MHIKPKKSLGQNFLHDANIQRKIIASCKLSNNDTVLEIGAGRGELTRLIADNVSCLYALEIDSVLCALLLNKFKDYNNVKIINQDFLKFNFATLFTKTAKKLKVIGNIPYYIATPILARLIKNRKMIKDIFITVQKEFGQRVIAKEGSKDYGALSCFVQYYTQPQILFHIKKTCFFPAPKVDSCFLYLDVRNKPLLKKKDEELFFRIVRAAFNKRRKTLRNSLKGIIPMEKLGLFFATHDINCNIRPEDLSLENFAHLAKI
jgi:16S rRNA (adenine1518-N6/adenine1519-N6)-dimethyltransferase